MCVWFSGSQEKNRLLAKCAIHLRKFNDALLINDTVRMVDALRLLEDFYETQNRNVLDFTDEYLTALFTGTDRFSPLLAPVSGLHKMMMMMMIMILILFF